MLIPNGAKADILAWLKTCCDLAKEPAETGEEKAFAKSFVIDGVLYKVVVSFEDPDQIIIRIKRKVI